MGKKKKTSNSGAGRSNFTVSRQKLLNMVNADGSTRSTSTTKRHETKKFNKDEEDESKQFYLCLVAGLFSFFVFLVYARTMHPSLPGGDSGELVTAAYESGVAHPPGYPLFTLLAKIFILLIPSDSAAFEVNLLSVSCAFVGSFFMFLTIYRLTHSYCASLLGTGMFAFSPLVWTWSTVAEVFTLNNLLISTLLYVAVCFDRRSEKNALQLCLLGSFVCGLCLSNQHTSVLYLAVIIPWVFYHLWVHQELSISIVALSGMAFVCGILPYAYLPISGWMKVARWTWGDHTSLAGFLTHILRREYGTLELLKDHTGQGFIAGLQAYFSHLIADFALPYLTLFFLSLWSLYVRQKSQGRIPSILSVFWVMLVAYTSFFCWRANLDISNPLFFKVVERFWLQSDLLFCILAGVAYNDIMRFLSTLMSRRNVDLNVLVAVMLVGMQLKKNYNACDQSRNYIIEDFAKQNLQAFPSDSIVLTKGDLPSNSFRYFHLCENVRPDLHMFDQEVLTYQWSVPAMSSFYPGITFPGNLLLPVAKGMPDGRRSFTFKQFIDANYDRHPIFACIGVQESEPSWKQSYTLWPFGVCYKFVKKGTVFDAEHWIQNTSLITQQWRYNLSSFDDGTWDFVANSEMWRARTATALLLLDKAMELPDGDKKGMGYLEQSYKLYLQELSKHAIVPSYWHRNFAIVCELLARSSTGMDAVELLRKTKHHFEVYVEKVPDDPDVEKIERVIEELEVQLKQAL